MKFFSNLSVNKNAWLLLALSALALEFAALFFQYILDLKPCIMCIYQRVAIWAIFLAGIIGYFGCQQVLFRLIAYAFWGVGAIWGLLIAIEHVEIQSSTTSFLFGCEIIPNFPQWAPLHEWLPSLFAATGDCGEISWQFLGYSMPQWMIVVYGLYSALFSIVLLTRLQQTKMF
ncbi:disulfide bond formation protein B [Thalassotalea insulae]|uniref:Disulfide bond formation protein B n=1 Tax=Thalassotalea insulae TaxID=2056778 RepID=A0ABQ6GXL9_9GAMM|nr:disulfide bond formation protein DsbB [Thalassotalea insulae]GLX80059.1 disulfide bond formation protein B [Thalassotalea insulae]